MSNHGGPRDLCLDPRVLPPKAETTPALPLRKATITEEVMQCRVVRPPVSKRLQRPLLNGGATQRGRQPATRDNSLLLAEKAGEDCRFRVRAQTQH